MGHVEVLPRNLNQLQEKETVEADVLQILVNKMDEEDWMCLVQREDPEVKYIMEVFKEKDSKTEEAKKIRSKYRMIDGRLIENWTKNYYGLFPKEYGKKF
ncbi:hypothetical protein JTB14_011858 [Gonioctena quinquepunctata]|nr:hypothetical protein JTB14_011858 [Gonioctena quinquepunctata]